MKLEEVEEEIVLFNIQIQHLKERLQEKSEIMK